MKEISELCPDISTGMITLTLQQLIADGVIAKTGAGRNVKYYKAGNTQGR